MTDETTTPDAAADPTADLHLTPRETGAWELATGIGLDQMPQSYLGALAQWKRAKDAGHPMSIDEALDSDWQDIGAALGVVTPDPTGSAGTPTLPTSSEPSDSASP